MSYLLFVLPPRVARIIRFAALPLLLHCGSRTGLEARPSGGDAGTPVDAASPVDAQAPVDAAPPAEASSLPDASSCTPAPAGGTTVTTFPTTLVSLGIAVKGGTLYAGTADLGSMSPLYTGTITSVPALGGSAQTLASPAFNFGSLVSDGARLYYPQSMGTPQGPNGAIYRMLGLAAIDLATSVVHPIATSAPPWPLNSNLDSVALAATPAHPGVFWIGGPAGAVGPTTLSSWDAAGDTVSSVATGQELSGPAVDATRVYWADSGGGQGVTVFSAPLEGGQPTTLANVPGGTHGALLGVSSADVVFVTDYATGVIDAVSKQGGPVRHLVTASSSWVNAFAWVDDPYLYWADGNAPTTLQRIPVAGGPVDVVPTQGELQSLAFDACNVYVGTLGPGQVVARAK